MEKSGTIFLWVLLGILLPPACAENFTEPRKNENLSPFQQWRSAVECMMNVSDPCSTQNRLTLNGTINVDQTEVDNYCNQGCSQHTLDVLTCIHDVKKDFWFANKANVWTIKNLINDGCSNGTAITSPSLKSGAAAVAPGKAMAAAFVVSLVSLAFLTLSGEQGRH